MSTNSTEGHSLPKRNQLLRVPCHASHPYYHSNHTNTFTLYELEEWEQLQSPSAKRVLSATVPSVSSNGECYQPVNKELTDPTHMWEMTRRGGRSLANHPNRSKCTGGGGFKHIQSSWLIYLLMPRFIAMVDIWLVL